ncbi:hypothetical protein [Pseudoflavitalea rhizosphaerae]|uniref:hypothetical protein n=1 Tax=Pseudoflavitalea rhizosphaerae TaxID=1884793 RepID=UPI000F8EAD44|nr:hypothetical protein [Pseudoflavitalea rhizosphaerae]
MALEESFDQENKKLYDFLTEKGACILFEENSGIPCWRVQTCYKISAPTNIPDPAAMAHELLHVKLNLMGFTDDIYTYSHFNVRNSPFSIEFIGHMNNDLGHFKMLDEFLTMGYSVDEFLQDTPKDYFLGGMFMKVVVLQTLNNAGTIDLCKEILGIIQLISGAKLFELYKIKDPSTENGLHPDLILSPLKEINNELTSEIENLFQQWQVSDTLNNLWFYANLDAILKKYGIVNFNDCYGIK